MAFTTISSGQIGHKAPVTVDLFQLLYDNPIAIANGDSGAPSVLPNIAANVSAGAVGSYMFARRSTAGGVGYGGLVSGAELRPTSAIWGADAGVISSNLGFGALQSGTWMCAGVYVHEADIESGAGVTLAHGATLWVRVA